MKFLDQHEAGKASLLISLLLLALVSQAQGQSALRLTQSLAEQEREIESVYLSPDGRAVATISNKYKYRETAAKRILNIHRIFGSTDKLFAAGSTVKLWDLQTGELKWTLTEQAVESTVLGFSPDGKVLATHDFSLDGRVKLWEAATGKLKATLAGHGKRIYEAAFSPDGSTLATSYLEDPNVKLWDVRTGELRATLPVQTARPGTPGTTGMVDDWYGGRLIFSPGGAELATPDYHGTVKLWKVATGKLVAELPGSDEPLYAGLGGPSDMFSPDGKIVVTSEVVGVNARQPAYRVNLWDAESGRLLRTLDGAFSPARFSPDGKVLATGWVASKAEKRSTVLVKLWSVSTGALIRTLDERQEGLDQIVWSRDGRSLAAAGGGTYKLWLWEVESGRLKTVERLVRHHGFDFVSDYISNQDNLLFSPDSRALILANQKSMRLLDARTGALLQSPDKLGLPVLFTPGGRLLTRAAGRKSLAVWEIGSK